MQKNALLRANFRRSLILKHYLISIFRCMLHLSIMYIFCVVNGFFRNFLAQSERQNADTRERNRFLYQISDVVTLLSTSRPIICCCVILFLFAWLLVISRVLSRATSEVQSSVKSGVYRKLHAKKDQLSFNAAAVWRGNRRNWSICANPVCWKF